MLRDARADIRLFERSIHFEVLGGGKAHPFGGSMVIILNRLDRL